MENQSQKTEVATQTIAETRDKAQESTPAIKQKIHLSIEAASRLLFHLKSIEKNHPDVFKTIAGKYPSLGKNIEKIQGLTNMMQNKEGGINQKNLQECIENYNSLASMTNALLTRIKGDEQKKNEMQLVEMANGEIAFDETSVTPTEKQEMQRVAKEMYDMLFPESYTDRFVRWQTGETGKLTGANRIAAAPMNGIESAIKGVASIIDPETYTAAYEGIKAARSMSMEDFDGIIRAMKFTYENMSGTDKVAATIAFMTSFIMVFGGISKVKKSIDGIQMSSRIRNILNLGKMGRTGKIGTVILSGEIRSAVAIAKYGPIAALTGIALPYIPIAQH